MGQWLSGLLGWSGSHGSKDSGTDNRDVLIDELCLKIAGGQTAAALRIIKSVPNVNKLSRRFHLAPLHVAVEAGNVNCVQMLLQHSADVNIKDCRLFSPLHIAAGAQGVAASCVQLLLEAGADVITKDIWGKTPLHRAAICSQHEVMRLLLETGCDVNMKDGQDRSCLMYLAHCPPSDNQLVEMVLCYGANVNLKDKKGRSPFYFAMLSRQLRLMDLLIQKGADLKDPEPLKLAISRCYQDCVRLLLGNGATLSFDMIQIVLNKCKCGHRIDKSVLDVLSKYMSLLKLLFSAYGKPLSLECIRSTILELLFFINALKNQASVTAEVLQTELSQIIPLIVSVNSVPVQVIQPLLFMFEEHHLLRRVTRELCYSDIPPLMYCCRTRIRQELSRNNTNILYTVNRLTSLPSLLKDFITVSEFVN